MQIGFALTLAMKDATSLFTKPFLGSIISVVSIDEIRTDGEASKKDRSLLPLMSFVVPFVLCIQTK
jgi:hypothetical protein